MTVTDVTGFRRNLTNFLEQAAKEQEVIQVGTDENSVIVLGAEAYRNLVETLNLMSVPGMTEKLIDGMNTPIEECDDFEW